MNYIKRILVLILLFGVPLTITACVPTTTKVTHTFQTDMTQTNNVVQSYWVAQFSKRGRDYTPVPKLVVYDSTGDIKCGKEVIEEDNAVYCNDKNFVAYDNSWMTDAYNRYGPGVIYMIIAHEYAHSVQFKIDESQQYTIEYELQADCMAGAFIKDAFNNGKIIINQSEMDNMVLFIKSLADSSDTKPRDDDAHGNADQRYNAFLVGFNGGLGECGAELNPYQEVY